MELGQGRNIKLNSTQAQEQLYFLPLYKERFN
jgi:hypothetical protein